MSVLPSRENRRHYVAYYCKSLEKTYQSQLLLRCSFSSVLNCLSRYQNQSKSFQIQGKQPWQWKTPQSYTDTAIHQSWLIADLKRQIFSEKFYHQFSIVKYSYLPTDTFRKYVERHVTWRKLALKFTGYCRQTSYTDSAVIHTLVPAVAQELQSQFAPGYMHFNIIF